MKEGKFMLESSNDWNRIMIECIADIQPSHEQFPLRLRSSKHLYPYSTATIGESSR